MLKFNTIDVVALAPADEIWIDPFCVAAVGLSEWKREVGGYLQIAHIYLPNKSCITVYDPDRTVARQIAEAKSAIRKDAFRAAFDDFMRTPVYEAGKVVDGLVHSMPLSPRDVLTAKSETT